MGPTKSLTFSRVFPIAGFSLRVAILGFVYSVILLPWWLRDIYEWSGLGMRDISLLELCWSCLNPYNPTWWLMVVIVTS